MIKSERDMWGVLRVSWVERVVCVREKESERKERERMRRDKLWKIGAPKGNLH